MGISLLTDFEKVGSHLDWEIGVHGIWIEFPLNGRKTTATYLPEVTAEQGWSKIEAIDSLLKKGGWKGEITDGVRGQIILTRYQSKKEVVTFEEWFTHRSNSVN